MQTVMQSEAYRSRGRDGEQFAKLTLPSTPKLCKPHVVAQVTMCSEGTEHDDNFVPAQTTFGHSQKQR